MNGDQIINSHGSWSHDKAYATGLGAADLVVSYLQNGKEADRKQMNSIQKQPET